MITEGLTLRVEAKAEHLAVEDFVGLVETAVSLLNSVARKLPGDERHMPNWKIGRLSLNGPLVISLLSDADDLRAVEAISIVARGLRQLEQDAVGVPTFFALHELEDAKRLVAPLTNGIARLTLISATDGTLTLTLRAAARADELLPKPHFELGELVGRLESSSADLDNRFLLRDAVTERRIECRFADDLVPGARAALDRRVAVTGRIYYDRTERPVSVTAESLRELREQRELPQFGDLVRMGLPKFEDPVQALQASWGGL